MSLGTAAEKLVIRCSDAAIWLTLLGSYMKVTSCHAERVPELEQTITVTALLRWTSTSTNKFKFDRARGKVTTLASGPS